MWRLLLAEENLLFSAALMLMLMIAMLEVVAILVGQSISGSLESLVPDDLFSPHTEIGLSDTDTSLSRLLGWLRIGEVPLLMLLVLFLFTFGILGLVLQTLSHSLLGFYLPLWIAGIAALILSIPCVRFLGGILHRLLPGDETSAVSADDLIGRLAAITLGTARSGFPAEAKVKDQHGYTHYLRVEPDDPKTVLPAGSIVLLLSRDGGLYKVMENPNPHLSDHNI